MFSKGLNEFKSENSRVEMTVMILTILNALQTHFKSCCNKSFVVESLLGAWACQECGLEM